MNWFYFIDKPLKYSSFDVIRVLKKKLNIKRIGHTWTLDPLATGGLLIAVWNYTKLIPYLEKDIKEYEFTINFDWESESIDLWTEVNYFSEDIINNFKKNIDIKKIKNILSSKFTWEISQIAPKYSAKKINWKRAYALIRAGEIFEIKANNVNIFNIDILDYDFPKLKLKVKVSAWTYVRSIAYDLARELWLDWSYVSYLRRLKIANLDVSIAQDLDNFNMNNTLELSRLFNDNRFIKLNDKLKLKIDNWLKVKWNFDFEQWKDLFVLFEDKITNIVFYDWEKLVPKKKI